MTTDVKLSGPGSESFGQQEPRILHLPTTTKVGSFGEEAFALCDSAGLTLDPWQKLVLDGWLSYGVEGLWTARNTGLIVSRQNGKGSLIEARELAGLFLMDEELIVHTAHLVPTALEGYRRLRHLIETTPDLRRKVAKFVDTNGQEGIHLKTGQRILFRARSPIALRGMTIDLLIMDEAMVLPEDVSQASIPAQAAVPNPQTIYTGSAGDKKSFMLARLRNAALQGQAANLHFAEWSVELCKRSCPPECTTHLDRYSYEAARQANPGLGIRLSWANTRAEQTTMDQTAYERERLGIGDYPVELNGWTVLSETEWRSRTNMDPAKDLKTLCLGVDMTPDREWTTLVVAMQTDDGGVFAEIPMAADGQIDHRQGWNWAVDRLAELSRRWNNAPVAIDPATQAKVLIDPLEALKVPVLKMTMRDYGEACQTFVHYVTPAPGDSPRLWHSDQAPLATALTGVGQRDMKEFWAWDRGESNNLITPLVAMTNAVWATGQPRPKRNAAPFAMRVKPNRPPRRS